MTLSHEQAQELHRLLGGPIEAADGVGPSVTVELFVLERARELAAIMVADTMPDAADNVSYAPCVTGNVEIGGRVSEFMIPLDPESSTRYSQWGADNMVLWPRTDLLEKMADAAREWVLDYPEEEDGDGPEE